MSVLQLSLFLANISLKLKTGTQQTHVIVTNIPDPKQRQKTLLSLIGASLNWDHCKVAADIKTALEGKEGSGFNLCVRLPESSWNAAFQNS